MSKCITYKIRTRHYLLRRPENFRTMIRNMLLDIMKEAKNPMQIALLLSIITAIVFETKITSDWSEWADTPIGRILIIGIFLLLEALYHWSIGILWILFALLLISPQKSRIATEGFADISIIDSDKSKRWFVENLLKENPVIIKDREVVTYPVQQD